MKNAIDSAKDILWVAHVVLVEYPIEKLKIQVT